MWQVGRAACIHTTRRTVWKAGHDMRRRHRFFRAGLGGLGGLGTLVLARPCWGHALTPFHYPIGPYPIFVDDEHWYILPALAVAIFVEVLVLKLLARRVSLAGNLWRGVLMHAAARGVEFALLYVTVLGNWGWTGGCGKTFVSTALLLAAGMAARALLARVLYRRSGMRWRRAVRAGVSTALAGYGVILLFALPEVLHSLGMR